MEAKENKQKEKNIAISRRTSSSDKASTEMQFLYAALVYRGCEGFASASAVGCAVGI